MNYDCYAKKKKKKKKTLSIWIHPVRPNYYLHFATQSYMASTSQQSDAWVLENLKSKASILITCPLPPSVFCSRLFRKDVKYCPSQSPKPSTACNPVTDTCSRQVEITRLKFLRHLNSCFTGKWITKPLCNHENQSFKTELLTATKANTMTIWSPSLTSASHSDLQMASKSTGKGAFPALPFLQHIVLLG